MFSPVIKMQRDTEIWHKNFLSDEGTGINIYEILKNLNGMIYKDKQNTIDYFQNLLNQRLAGEHDNYEGATNILRKKISELEYQNKLLNENYKSSEQEVKRDFLNKLALAETKSNDAYNQLNSKDDEISVLKREIDNLRNRLQEAYSEKDRLAIEMDDKIRNARIEEQLNKNSSDENLNRAQDIIKKQEINIQNLETRLANRDREAQENENAYKRQIELLKSQATTGESRPQDLSKQKIEYERIIEEKEQQRLRQKNEWAEVYYILKLDLRKPKTRN